MNEKGQLHIVQEFLRMIDGHIVDIKEKETIENQSMFWANNPLTNDYISCNIRKKKVINMDVDMENFSRAVEELKKYHLLMSNPQSRQLIHEAEFIYRLERGRYDLHNM